MKSKTLDWGSLEWFVLLLFLLNGLLLLPGTQPLRFAIRGMPYLASLALWVILRRNSQASVAPGGFAILLTLALLALNLFQPEAQWKAGIAQIVFQLAIVSPVLWVRGFSLPEQRLLRLLWIVFLCNAAGSVIGILQIYFPDRFLPAEFSAGASESWLRSLTFVSPSGRVLVRPPGLSDLPGGAAVAGSLTAIMGLAFSASRKTKLLPRLACFACAVAGIGVLYLTQVRSLALMTLAGIAMLGLLVVQQKQIWNRGWMAFAAVTLVFGSFIWAVAVGGDKVRDRFLNITEQGLAGSYESSRGSFWRYTFGEALDQYPLGASPGRWGMMSVYFGDSDRADSPPLWAEIQPTGWLLDGGVPMWILCGVALAASMLFLFRVARSSRYGPAISFGATLIFCINLNIIGASLSGPAFNTTMGLEYWLLTAVLYGAARQTWHTRQSSP